MKWRSLGTAADGTQQWSAVDPQTGEIHLKTTHPDVSDVLKRNQQLRSDGHGNGKDMKLAASIPLSVIHDWKVKHGIDAFSPDPEQKKKLRQLLNDHTNRMFRIWEGNI